MDNLQSIELTSESNSHLIRREMANVLGLTNLIGLEVDNPAQLRECVMMLEQSAHNLNDAIKVSNTSLMLVIDEY